jgi:hypothetical protein
VRYVPPQPALAAEFVREPVRRDHIGMAVAAHVVTGDRHALGACRFGAGCVALGGLELIAMPFVSGTAPKIAMMAIGISVPAVIYVMGMPW